MKVALTIGLVLTAALMSMALYAQEPDQGSRHLDQVLPLDPSVRVGTLDNGLRYYVRANSEPEKRAELRLVVKAGALMENPDQQGLAHFVEHMAFNGTRHFEGHEIVSFLESIGMRFGADLNAYTSFDETVYMLQVPTDRRNVLDTAFRILQDWAHGIAFAPEEIEKERGVVIEEWRLRQGAEQRMNDKQTPVLYYQSRYAERLPIGRKEVLDTFHHETLKTFYRDWYRPDLMAVIAVGDFDVDAVERMIRSEFGSIPTVADPRERRIYGLPMHREPLVSVETDPEASRSMVSVYYKHPRNPDRTVADYRHIIIENIYNRMLSRRLSELTQQADPPFLYAFSTKYPFGKKNEFYMLSAGVQNSGIERGLETVLTEAERVRRFGFTEGELERAKREMVRGMEQLYKERDKTESYSYAGEYTQLFLNEVPAPGIAYEYDLYRTFVPEITVEEVNALARVFLSEENRVILATAPEKEGVEVPDEKDLLALFGKVEGKTLEPYTETVSDAPLVENKPEMGSIVSERMIDTMTVLRPVEGEAAEPDTVQMHLIEWTLSNGARVVMFPTDFQNDQVLFSAFSPGGHSLASDSAYYYAVTAADIVPEGGLGRFNRIELSKILTGKVAGVYTYISELYEGAGGNASTQDLETMFQLIYLNFTAPRRDTTAFESYLSRMNAFLQNRDSRPETAFSDTVNAVLSNYHFRRRPFTTQMVEQLDLDSSMAFYQDRFADAGDFTFILVGNFEPENIRNYVLAYIGGLPSKNGTSEQWQDIGVQPPTGVIEKKVYRGLEPKGQVRIVFTGKAEWSRTNQHTMQAMVDILRIRLREKLREEKGGTYGVGLFASLNRIPEERYSATVTFGCDPERIDELTEDVFTLIDTFKKEGPTAEEIANVEELERRELETSVRENTFWLAVLQGFYMNNETPADIMRDLRNRTKTNAQAVRNAARQYFDTRNYVRVILLPENMASAGES